MNSPTRSMRHSIAITVGMRNDITFACVKHIRFFFCSAFVMLFAHIHSIRQLQLAKKRESSGNCRWP